MPMCDSPHSLQTLRFAALTSHVSCCPGSTQIHLSVTPRSRADDDYQAQARCSRLASKRQPLPVSGARQYGHPGFPLFLRPPGARSISTRPRGRQAAGPRHFRVRAAFQESRVHKRRRHPEGCRLASSHGTRSNPCPFDLSPRSSPASAHESARPMQHEPCQRTGKLR